MDVANAPSEAVLSMTNLPIALIGSAMAAAFIAFARFANNRYGSSRSCVVKGKAFGLASRL
jgi:hypothetical protein